ncbi:MAG: hypothetical protein O3C60_19280 [Planctomycetota bacterium]|nr:hypothetical protein [Planctomycetota bacterium]
MRSTQSRQTRCRPFPARIGSMAMRKVVMVAVGWCLGQSQPVRGDLVARDDFDVSVRRLAFEQTPVAGTFSSIDDSFQVYQVGAGRVPPQLLDTSLTATDNLGIVRPETKTDKWFGVSDIKNPDNLSGLGVLNWQFDVTGFNGLSFNVQLGAMGDFEVDDVYDWKYSWDGTTYVNLLISTIDLAGSHEYTLANGTKLTLDDPVTYGNVPLTNILADFSAPIAGTGPRLWIRLEAAADGGTEAYILDDLRIMGTPIATPRPSCDINGDRAVDGVDIGVVYSNWNGSAAGDISGDGLVDGADAAICFAEWTGDGWDNAAVSVPEPHALRWDWLVGGIVFAVRKNLPGVRPGRQ